MKVNFEIEDNYAVQYKGRHIDLHNNFELVEIRDLNNHIEIEFKKTDGDWVELNELNELVFIFNKISFKYEEKGEGTPTSENWKVLGELSFFPSSMRGINDKIIDQRRANEDDDIIFFFENGRLIRIHSEDVKLQFR